MRVLVFVSSHCPHCPNAERLVKRVTPDYKEHGVSFSKVRIKTSGGKILSKKYGVRGTPTIILINNDGVELKRHVGTPSEDKFRSMMEKAIGLKKSFFSRLFGK